VRAALVLMLTAISLLAVLPLGSAPGSAGDEATILRVGQLGQIVTRNPLPLIATDVWTRDVLERVYDRPVKEDGSGTLPYIAKGVDADEDGQFETSEHGVYAEQEPPRTPLELTAYYDFNGVRWHDGVQVTVWDLLFSYHVNAMNPIRSASFRVLLPTGAPSYETGDRQLGVVPDAGTWEDEGSMPGDPALRAAVRFTLNAPYARFASRTLAPTLLPMHVWSRTGGGRHAEFGCAIWLPPTEAADRGLPECGSTSPSSWGRGIGVAQPVPGSSPYAYVAAEAWEPSDADVIGSGPFSLVAWRPGVDVFVERYDDYYVGETYDPRLATFLRRPFIGGIRFLQLKSLQLAMFALQAGDIDVFHGNVGAEYVPDLLGIPSIAIESNADPSFTHLAYNLRRAPWGYAGGDPSADVGFVLRQAIAHLIDRRQWCGWWDPVCGYGPVTPANTFWYNDNLAKPQYDPYLGAAILDSAEARAAGITEDPPGPCASVSPGGCRGLSGIGNATFTILTPQASVEPVLASAGAMIADGMRRVGLNAASVPTPRTDLLVAVASGSFDLFLGRWEVAGPDPDFLFDILHGSNAAGTNFAGVANATLDAELEVSREALDRNVRRDHVYRVQELFADLRPFEVLYYRTNIEGYRQDRFVNWTVVAGTIWNEWSLFGIRAPPAPASPRLSLTAPSGIRSGAQDIVTAAVADQSGRALAGATVALTVDTGTLSLGGANGTSVSGTTAESGRIVASFRAPVASNVTTVLLLAVATHPDFRDPATRGATITIFPPEVTFLSLTLEFPVGDLVRPGEAVPVRIAVRDQEGAPVQDASVLVESSDPARLRPSATNGNAADLATLTIEADASIANPESFRLAVTANKTGYEGASRSATITVVPLTPWYRCPDGTIVADPNRCPTPPSEEGFPTGLAVALGTPIIVAAVAAIYVVRRGRKRPR